MPETRTSNDSKINGNRFGIDTIKHNATLTCKLGHYDAEEGERVAAALVRLTTRQGRSGSLHCYPDTPLEARAAGGLCVRVTPVRIGKKIKYIRFQYMYLES